MLITSGNDRHVTLYNINTLSSNQVMKILQLIEKLT